MAFLIATRNVLKGIITTAILANEALNNQARSTHYCSGPQGAAKRPQSLCIPPSKAAGYSRMPVPGAEPRETPAGMKQHRGHRTTFCVRGMFTHISLPSSSQKVKSRRVNTSFVRLGLGSPILHSICREITLSWRLQQRNSALWGPWNSNIQFLCQPNSL